MVIRNLPAPNGGVWYPFMRCLSLPSKSVTILRHLCEAHRSYPHSNPPHGLSARQQQNLSGAGVVVDIKSRMQTLLRCQIHLVYSGFFLKENTQQDLCSRTFVFVISDLGTRYGTMRHTPKRIFTTQRNALCQAGKPE